MNLKNALVIFGLLAFSASAFAGKPVKSASSLCGNEYTAKYYAPYDGVSDVIGLWDAYNYWNTSGLPIDHKLSIAIIFANYVTHKSNLNVEITQRDLAGNIVPFNSSQPTVTLSIAVGACSSGQTGVLVQDDAPAGEYILSAKVSDSSPGAQMRINLN